MNAFLFFSLFGVFAGLAIGVAGDTQHYQKTCPPSASDFCSPGNKCSSCHTSCRYCQNLSNTTCGSDDCMVCQPGLYLVIKYSDGTGPCVEKDKAYLPTCPKEEPGCAPGNSCLACPKGCTACLGSTLICEAHRCIACAEGLVHTPAVPGLRTGRCLPAIPGFKKTCPPYVEGCSDANQCVSCPAGCKACQNTRRTECGPKDCVSCLPGYVLEVEQHSKQGRCVRPQKARSQKATEASITATDHLEWLYELTRKSGEPVYTLARLRNVGVLVGATVLGRFLLRTFRAFLF